MTRNHNTIDYGRNGLNDVAHGQSSIIDNGFLKSRDFSTIGLKNKKNVHILVSADQGIERIKHHPKELHLNSSLNASPRDSVVEKQLPSIHGNGMRYTLNSRS